MSKQKKQTPAFVAELPLEQIHVPTNGNYRLSVKAKGSDSIESLRRSIRDQGQLAPVVVRQTSDDQYYLVAGFRRFEAISGIKGRTTISARVLPSEGKQDAVGDLAINAVENMQRADLSSWEQSELCVQLRGKLEAQGVSGADVTRQISRICGKTKDWSVQYLRHRDSLSERCLAAWRDGDVRMVKSRRNELSKLGHDEQDAWLDGDNSDSDDSGDSVGAGDSDNGAPSSRARRPHKKKLEKALDALAEADWLSDEYRAGARNALRYALGVSTDEIDGEIVPVLAGLNDSAGLAEKMNLIGDPTEKMERG